MSVFVSFVPLPRRDPRTGYTDPVALARHQESIENRDLFSIDGNAYFRTIHDEEGSTFFISRHGLDYMETVFDAEEVGVGNDIIRLRERVKKQVEKAVAFTKTLPRHSGSLSVSLLISLEDQHDVEPTYNWFMIRFGSIGDVIFRAQGLEVHVDHYPALKLIYGLVAPLASIEYPIVS